MPWPDTTLQQCRDTAQPVATALGSWLEDPALLPVEPAHPQGDDGSLLLWHVRDILDEALDNCRGRRQRSADLKGTVSQPGHVLGYQRYQNLDLNPLCQPLESSAHDTDSVGQRYSTDQLKYHMLFR